MNIVDFHSHILPRADHGSSSVEDSLCQIQFARQSGVTDILATPHFYPANQSVPRFLEKRLNAYDLLSQALDGDTPRIHLGAEVLICDSLENLPELERLCIEGTNVLLLELPFNDFSISYKSTVKSLIKRGINVVLAHADRYDPRSIELLIDAGAKIQLNTDSFAGLIKPRHLYDWIERGLVVALGSDIHGRDKKAYRFFLKAVKKIGENNAKIIFESSLNLLDQALVT